MPLRNPDVVVVAFLEALLADREAGRLLDLAHYQRRFPGYEDALASALEDLEHSSADATTRDVENAQSVGSLQIGESFAGYRIEGVLGAGGQAIVYLANDPELDRMVALKVLRDANTWSTQARARFEREVELMVRLQHPAICPVYARGFENGIPWVAMQALDGASLASQVDKIASGSWREATRIVREAADAVAFAHVRGVVHRDLKPSNLWLDAQGRVIVLDFGLAVETSGPSTSGELTRSIDRFGTPGYMAPEQLSSTSASHATDVFGLGVTLFQLTTGRLPFPAATLGTYERALETGPQEIRRIRRGLPRDLSALIRVATAYAPEERYANASALRADLDALLTSKPIAAAPPGPIVRALRWARREPAVATSLGAMLLVLLVGWLLTSLALEQAEKDAARSAVTAAASLLQDKQSDAARTALASCPDGRGGFVRQLLESELDGGMACPLPPDDANLLLVNRDTRRITTRSGHTYPWPNGHLRAAATISDHRAAIASKPPARAGSRIAVLDRDGVIGTQLDLPDDAVVAMCQATDSRWLWCLLRPLGVVRQQRLEAWSLAAGERLWSREVRDGRDAQLLALSDHRVVLGWPDGTLQVIHADGRPDVRLAGHRAAIERLQPTSNGFVSVDTGGHARTWPNGQDGVRRYLQSGAQAVSALRFEQHLRVWTDSDLIIRWDLDHDLPRSCESAPVPLQQERPPTAKHPNEALTVKGLGDGSVQFLAEPEGIALATLTSGSSAVQAIAFSPDGNRLAVGHADGLVTVFDARGWPEPSPDRHVAPARAIEALRNIGHETALLGDRNRSQPGWRQFAMDRLLHRRIGHVRDEYSTLLAMPYATRGLHEFATTQLELQLKHLPDPSGAARSAWMIGLLRTDRLPAARLWLDEHREALPQLAGLLRCIVDIFAGTSTSTDVPAVLQQSNIGPELMLRSSSSGRAALAWLQEQIAAGHSPVAIQEAGLASAPAELRPHLQRVLAVPERVRDTIRKRLRRLLVRNLPATIHQDVRALVVHLVRANDQDDLDLRSLLAAARLRAGDALDAKELLKPSLTQAADWRRHEFDAVIWFALAEAECHGAQARIWADRAQAIALRSAQAQLLEHRLLLAELQSIRR